ncbi:hypothetical protein SSP531S_32190 [Streptomyces spongiicola]|uniref:Uncharacterized protein n=1 Tax=Streptomyces spongiicola TaxID=1690221 RepID=A0A388T0W4_9ACTN|nr:hypothetical protein SSP531S_32190 [Streptomyces spongiicola]
MAGHLFQRGLPDPSVPVAQRQGGHARQLPRADLRPARPHGADLRVEIQPGVGVRRLEYVADPGTLYKPFDGRVPPARHGVRLRSGGTGGHCLSRL